MKKVMKIAFITSLVFILLGGGLMLGGWLLGGHRSFEDVDLNTMEKYHTIKKSLDEDIKNIEVDVYRYPVSFEMSKDSKVHYRARLVKDEDVEFTQDGGTLKITEKGSTKGHVETDLNLIGEIFSVRKNAEIVVYLPEKDYENFQINGAGADIYMNKVSIKNLKIDISAGDINIDKSKIAGGEINADAGEVNIEGSILSDVIIGTSAGDIDVEKGQLKNVKLKTEMGDINLERLEYDGGSVYVNMGDLNEDNVKYISPVKKDVPSDDDY